MPADVLDKPATPDRIAQLVVAGAIPRAAAGRAYAIAGATPPAAEWGRILRRVLLVLGALLTVAGVVFFFAYNWAKIPAFGKFGILLGGITLAVGVAHYRTLARESGKIALVVAAVLIGPLLAVYGQRYQTGADPYELFLAWGLLTLPWALAGRSSLLWGVSVALGDVTIGLYCDQVRNGSSWGDDTTELPAVAAFHFIALAVFEWVLARPRSWLTSPYLHRLLALVGLFALTAGACAYVVEKPHDDPNLLACACGIPVAWLLMVLFYRFKRRDVPMLAMAGTSIVAVFTMLAGKHLVDGHSGDIFILFCLGGILIGEIALLTAWLRAELRRGGGD